MTPSAPSRTDALLAALEERLRDLSAVDRRLAAVEERLSALDHLDRRLAKTERALSNPGLAALPGESPATSGVLPAPLPASQDEDELPPGTPSTMVPVEEVAARLNEGLSQAERAEASLQGRASVIRPPRPEEQFKDRSMIVICPTRGAIPTEVCETWPSLAWPMNQRRNGPMFAKGYDVASAYNALIEGILVHPILKTWKYVFTFEDDNLLPYDAPLRLLEVMEAGPQNDPEGAVDFQGRPLVREWAGVSGLYFTKDALHSPMAYGDPVSYRKNGKTNYYPVDLSALKEGEHLIECNGIAMGCALWRLDYFRRVKGPWFMTVEDRIMVNGQLLTPDEAQPFVDADPQGDFKKLATQDIYWAERAIREVGARFVVDTRVRVGHLDTATGRIF